MDCWWTLRSTLLATVLCGETCAIDGPLAGKGKSGNWAYFDITYVVKCYTALKYETQLKMRQLTLRPFTRHRKVCNLIFVKRTMTPPMKIYSSVYVYVHE